MINQDIWPDQAFHRVEHLRMAHQFVHPGEQQMRLRAHQIRKFAEGVALFALEMLKARAVMPYLVLRQAVDREEVAVAAILRDLGGRQAGGHGVKLWNSDMLAKSATQPKPYAAAPQHRLYFLRTGTARCGRSSARAPAWS